jgi:pimeloyl-ACP methyl ester carboxylesterase
MTLETSSTHEKFISVNNLKIFYTDTNESHTQILFFIHGNSSSHRAWTSQINSDQFKTYRVITFDLPGHGSSSASNNAPEDYSVIGMGAIMASAVKHIAADNRYFLIGFCYGSNVIAEMLTDNAITPVGVIFISTNVLGENIPLEQVFRPNEKMSVLFKDDSGDDEIIALWENEINNDSALLENMVQDHKSVDKKFRSTLAQTVVDKKWSDEIKIIRERNIPVVAIFGELDSMVNIDYLDGHVPDWKIIKLKNTGHLVHINSAIEVNRLIAAYINKEK